ncbi:MAG TPA: carboxymuconolactone decarboxylase family protein [Euzebya sp.]|nr:carboxymuconolactone decarboxylase family protein [Euzebya sp.]
MPAVELLDAHDAPMLAQPYYAGGDPGPITRALAHVPELLEVTLPFIDAALGPSAIDLRTKEIVILRTSAVLGCHYCVQTHAVVAHDADLSVAQVDALAGADPDAIARAFPDDRDRALIAWTDTVALGPGIPPGDVVIALRAHMGDAELVELTVLVGATLMLNRFATTLGLPTSAKTLRRLASDGLLGDHQPTLA